MHGTIVAEQRLRGSGLPEILLHVTRLTVAFERRIERFVAWPIGVTTARPFAIRSLDRKSADPVSFDVLHRYGVRDVVAGGAHLRAFEEDVVVALVNRSGEI